ncbi:MAG: hypothetical protein ABI560_01140, partial [Myxococcales bacterium]
MKLCPTCKTKYSDDANFCPREECAGAGGPQRLVAEVETAPVRFVPVSRIGGGPSGEVWQASDAQAGSAAGSEAGSEAGSAAGSEAGSAVA